MHAEKPFLQFLNYHTWII